MSVAVLDTLNPSALGALLDVREFGADTTGATDVRTAIQKAILASTAGVYVPKGTYALGGYWDWSTFLPSRTIDGWMFVCDNGVTWKGNGMRIAAVNGFQFINCRFELGEFDGSASPSNTDNLTLAYIDVSYVRVVASKNGPGTGRGLVIDSTSGATYSVGFFNNDLHFNRLNSNGGNGLALLSGTNGQWAIQGNRVYVGHCYDNGADGILIDGATGHGTMDNEFDVLSEFNSGYGISDYNGRQVWIIRGTDNNTSGGYRLAAGAGYRPVIISAGCFDTTPYVLNGQSPALLVDAVQGNQTRGAVLASQVYDPATSVVKSTTSSAAADVDTTNAVLPAITVPASGVVDVEFEGFMQVLPGTSQATVCIGLYDAATGGLGDIASTQQQVIVANASTLTTQRVKCTMRISGLAQGSTLGPLRLRWYLLGTTGAPTAYMGYGQSPQYGALRMVARAA